MFTGNVASVGETLSAVPYKSLGSSLALVLTNLWMRMLLNLSYVRECTCIFSQLDESKSCYFLNSVTNMDSIVKFFKCAFHFLEILCCISSTILSNIPSATQLNAARFTVAQVRLLNVPGFIKYYTYKCTMEKKAKRLRGTSLSLVYYLTFKNAKVSSITYFLATDVI